jgi:hypothetical protein
MRGHPSWEVLPRGRVSHLLHLVSFGLLISGGGPRGHEFFHHAAVSELVLDGVCVVQTFLLKKSLKLVCQQLRLALDTVPDGPDTLLIEVVRFLVVVIIRASRGCNPLRMSFGA